MAVRARFGLAGLTGVLLTIAGVHGQQPPQTPNPSGFIVGQVVDAATGKPMGGAIVTIGPSPAPPPRILTGADGRFLFRDLPRGSFSVSATKPGYAEGSYGRRRPGGLSQQITLADAERVGDASIRMWKLGAISGTVVDEAGEPLVGVQIRGFRRALTGRRRFFNTATTATDDRGVYRLGNLTPGEYVVAAASRQVALPLTLAMSGELRSATPSLPGTPSSILIGDVVYGLDPARPVPPPITGGRLFVYPTTFHPAAAALAQATTITVASGEERNAIDLQLQPVPSVRVSGTVIGPEGQPPVGVQLLPASVDEIALELDTPAAMTDRNGAFTFPAVPSGPYSLRCLLTELPLTVGTADIDGLAVVLQKGLRISGRMEFDGSAEKPQSARLEQITVVIEPLQETPTAGIALRPRVDGSGQFTTAALPPGKYFVRIGASPTGWMFKSAMHEGRDVSETPLELKDGDVSSLAINFTDRWTGLSGTVHSSTGQGDADAIVLVFPTDPQAWTNLSMSPRRVRSARTTKSGEYKLISLPPGDYYVVALPDEQAADWQDPKFMEMLARVATVVTIGEGEHRTQELRTREVR